MTSAVDVAALIHQRGIHDSWKVQKLLYYCQAWSLAWDGVALFVEEIRAWRDGPVCLKVYRAGSRGGDPTQLSTSQLETVEAVLGLYGRKSPDWLVELTHREKPWIDARGDADARAHSDRPIEPDSMLDFYRGYGVEPKTFTSSFEETLELLVSAPEGLPHPSEDDQVDGEAHLRWLESGEGEPPWVKSGA
jgi:uncharacterized phage-associated protein